MIPCWHSGLACVYFVEFSPKVAGSTLADIKSFQYTERRKFLSEVVFAPSFTHFTDQNRLSELPLGIHWISLSPSSAMVCLALEIVFHISINALKCCVRVRQTSAVSSPSLQPSRSISKVHVVRGTVYATDFTDGMAPCSLAQSYVKKGGRKNLIIVHPVKCFVLCAFQYK